MAFDHQLECDRAAAAAAAAANPETVGDTDRGSFLAASTILLGKVPLLLLVAVLRYGVWIAARLGTGTNASTIASTNKAPRRNSHAFVVSNRKNGTVLGWQPSLHTISEEETHETNRNRSSSGERGSHGNVIAGGDDAITLRETALRFWHALILLVVRLDDAWMGTGLGSSLSLSSTSTSASASPSSPQRVFW